MNGIFISINEGGPMSVRKMSLLLVTVVLSVSCFAINPIKRGTREVWRPVSHVNKFKIPVVPVQHGSIKRLPSFSPKATFVSPKQSLDLVTARYSTVLHENLVKDLLALEEDGDISFSGLFVPSRQALLEEMETYIRPEFGVSADQAVRDMLDQAADHLEGFGIIKVIQIVPGKEPRQTILVMDLQKDLQAVSWTQLPPQEISSTVIPSSDIFQQYPSIHIREGAEYLVFPVGSSEGSEKGIVVYDEKSVQNIEDAYMLQEVDESGLRIPRKNPFYVRVTTYGDPDVPALHTAGSGVFDLVYEDYKLEYGATADGPFFSTIAEVEEYLLEQAENERIFLSDRSVKPQSPSQRIHVTKYYQSDEVNGPFFDTPEQAEEWPEKFRQSIGEIIPTPTPQTILPV